MTRGWKGLALRLAVAAALLALAFRLALPAGGPGVFESLASSWRLGPAASFGWFGVACAVLGVSFLAAGRRFQILLRGAGVAAGLFALTRGLVIASLFNTVLPSVILGDVYRLYDTKGDGAAGGAVAGVLVLERLLSLAVLGGFGLAALSRVPRDAVGGDVAAAIAAFAGGLIIASGAALLPATNRLLRRALPWLHRVWPRASDAARGALEAVLSLSDQPARVLRALGWSVVIQALPVLAVLALSVPLSAAVAPAWYFAIVPFVTLLALLPVSIGGAGIRESLYVALFGAVGMRPEVALALSLSAFAAALVWASVGLGLFALGRRRPKAARVGASR